MPEDVDQSLSDAGVVGPGSSDGDERDYSKPIGKSGRSLGRQSDNVSNHMAY